MARKDRNLAGFGEVAEDKVNKDINVNVNDEINNKIDDDITGNDNEDPLDKLLVDNKKKEDTHVLRGIYFEKEIAQVIDRLAKKGGRGMKSKIVNESLRKVFHEKGWL